jgi:cysteinyl-tRNA synthetase
MMGITDIDDKIINKANVLRISAQDLASKYEYAFINSMNQLNVKPPERYLRVSEHISEIKRFIEKLDAKGYTYRTSDGSIYLSISKYKESFKYPKFRPASNEIVDFALWKSNECGGRPGWHIECSAMSKLS